MRKIDVVLFTVSAITCITCSLAILFQNNEQLLYNGWLPFDYKTSDLKFNIAKYYQLIAIVYAIVHNYISDRFSIIAFYQLSAHVIFLHKRISRIGHDQENNVENEKYFRSCIVAQQRVNEYKYICIVQINVFKRFSFRLCTQIEDITTFPIFLQFTVTGITACLTLTLAVFYAEDNMTRLYFLFYAMAVLLGIFPVCYFGSELEYRFEQLHWSIYFSDWTKQSMNFKKDMLIFNERSLKHRALFAGGILRIHLPTFLSTCKGAYSMFAVVLRFKNDKTEV
ncbi:odorant receptor 59a-like [Teleopsis dalmanni]|uniref:odorant receptor 59a-like n=1 Tax=Teleopsis dalmanni TaxID=139649 RepID=UPI0018CD6439|nr:odorant receptor 59a-like [Teleopsis dalmanni]